MMYKHGSTTTERLVFFNLVLVTNNEFDVDSYFTLRFPVVGTIKLTKSKKARCSKNQYNPFLSFRCML